MARKQTKGKKFVFKGFVNLDFTPDQRTEILSWMEGFGESPVDAIIVLVEAMWKVSIGWDDYQGTFQVSLTCHDNSSRYFGMVFTLKHADPGRALLVFRYFYDSQLRNELYRLDKPQGDHDW